MFKWLPLLLLFWAFPAAAQNPTCPTRPAGDSTNACASTAFVNGGSGNVLPVPAGGTGATTFTPNNPLIGNGTGAIGQGTRSGTSTVFPVIDGTSTNGQCAVFDSSGGLTSQACTAAGSGTVTAGLANQYAFYPSNAASVSGLQAPYLHSKVFGATGNGSTNDATALQNWINACQASQQICWLDPGTYLINTTLTITNSVTIDAPGFISASLAPAIGIDAIDITTTLPVSLYRFGIVYPATAISGVQAINVTAGASAENTSSTFRDLRILNPWYGINFAKASGFTVDNVKIELFGGNAINIANANNSDSGDSTISSGYFSGGAGTPNACAFWQSSGGLKYVHNKCVITANGFQVNLAVGAATSQLIIEDNSFDGMTQNGFVATRVGTTGTLTEVIFSGNTCSSSLECFNVGLDATGVWLTNVQVSGNTFYSRNSGANVAFQLNSTTNATIVNNTLGSNAAGTVAFACGATATNVVYGIFAKLGTFAANVNSCGATAITPN